MRTFRMDHFDFRADKDIGAERRMDFGGKAVSRDWMVPGQIVAVPADGGIVQRSHVLIIGVLQRPAWSQNRHDDNALAKIRPITQTKLAGGPAFRRGRWPEFLKGLFWL